MVKSILLKRCALRIKHGIYYICWNNRLFQLHYFYSQSLNEKLSLSSPISKAFSLVNQTTEQFPQSISKSLKYDLKCVFNDFRFHSATQKNQISTFYHNAANFQYNICFMRYMRALCNMHVRVRCVSVWICMWLWRFSHNSLMFSQNLLL